MLEVGLSKELSEEVTKEKLASARGSGALDVYATPEMITMMEKASVLTRACLNRPIVTPMA